MNMTEQEILQLISQGESQTLEFKREEENNRDFAKTFAGFANSPEGGKILVGVDDSGKIVGVSNKNEIILKLNNIAFNNCRPPVGIFIETIKIEDKEIVVVNIPAGLQKPYKVSGITYIRSNNQTRESSREEEMRLYQSSLSVFFDEIPISQATINDLNRDLFEEFLKKYLELEIKEIGEIPHYLKNFHLITDEKIPTVTGILFFGYKPQLFIPYSKIVCAAFNDIDLSSEPFDKKELTGTIPLIIEQVETFLKIHLRNQHRIQNFSPESYPELPLTALRELVINAIAHRDYTISAPVRILLFVDRVEIHSPGLLPNTVTIESIKVGGSHVLRNPTIYNLLVKLKMVTDLGSGVKRSISLIKQATNKEPMFYLSENEFIVTILRS